MAMTKITNEKFRELYKACKTYGDFDDLIEALPAKFSFKLRDNLLFVQETTGLTMREDAFLSCLKSYIKYNVPETVDTSY